MQTYDLSDNYMIEKTKHGQFLLLTDYLALKERLLSGSDGVKGDWTVGELKDLLESEKWHVE